jgi:hypothetical protein
VASLIVRRIRFIFKILARRIRRKFGNRDLEKLETWYKQNYLETGNIIENFELTMVKLNKYDVYAQMLDKWDRRYQHGN